ncbi:MAG: alpha/beta hydrolase [Bradymonadales bacterium]|nr:alpha/beta hydrolase [Bradymonadales bacterium]
MELRHEGRSSTPQEIAERLGGFETERDLLFFVHGLMLDDSCWTASRFNLTKALEDRFDLAAVHLRYDTGLHISENGLAFARLLQELFEAAAPQEARWHIVAHSMGGLVARSALLQAEQRGFGFTRVIDRVFFLATPHRGAPLEKGVQLAQLVLRAIPYLPAWYTGAILTELLRRHPATQGRSLAGLSQAADVVTRRLGTLYLRLADAILDLRSDGIRDLRHGYLLEEQWAQRGEWSGMKATRITDGSGGSARTYAISGALSKKAGGRPSPLCSDGMVSTASAVNMGAGDRLRFIESGRYQHLPGVSHFAMTSDPRVFEVLARWLEQP